MVGLWRLRSKRCRPLEGPITFAVLIRTGCGRARFEAYLWGIRMGYHVPGSNPGGDQYPVPSQKVDLENRGVLGLEAATGRDTRGSAGPGRGPERVPQWGYNLSYSSRWGAHGSGPSHGFMLWRKTQKMWGRPNLNQISCPCRVASRHLECSQGRPYMGQPCLLFRSRLSHPDHELHSKHHPG